VTGASGGIGRAVAQTFAKKGAQIAVHYHQDREGAEKTLNSLAGRGHQIVQANVADPEMAPRLIAETIHHLQGLDILVNNAGIWLEHRIATVSFEHWRLCWNQIVSTNLFGPAHLTYCTAQHMIRQKEGRIVNISSRGAFRGEPEGPAYAASKAGLNAMSQSLAKALAPYNIFVHVVAPGFVETKMAARVLDGPEGDTIRQQSPLGRVAHPQEVADTVVFLASEKADFLTGGIVDVNGASFLRS